MELKYKNYDINRNFEYWFEFTFFNLNKMTDKLKAKMYRGVCVCLCSQGIERI